MEFKVGDRLKLTGEKWGPARGEEVGVGKVEGRYVTFQRGVSSTYRGEDWKYWCLPLPGWEVEKVPGGWTKEEIQKAAFKRAEDSFALSKDWDEQTDFFEKVNDVLTEVGRVLISKNQSYGDSALDPVRIFSKADSVEGLNQRIDDKLSRVQRGNDYGEDTITDLIGYLVLLKIAEGK